MTSPIIDHDPNEPPRPARGEAVIVPAITFVIVAAIVYGLTWMKNSYGLTTGLMACGVFLVLIFGMAFLLEARKRRHRS